MYATKQKQFTKLPMVVVFMTVVAVFTSSLSVPPAEASYGQQVRNMTATAGGVTALDMAQLILGGSTTVSNASFSGDQRAGGTVLGFGGIGLPTAAVLSTGLVGMSPGTRNNGQYGCGSYCSWASGSAVVGPNWFGQTVYHFGSGGDTDLAELMKGGNPYSPYNTSSDTATLQFDFVAKSHTVQIPFVFASDGYRANWQSTGYVYPDPANAYFSAGMGIWVNGTNCAVVGPRNEPVSVNTVNHLRNTDYYRDNPVVPEYSGESRYPTGFNGLTTVLNCTSEVKRNQVNHVKITIGNQWADYYDSGVFVGQGSFVPDVPDPGLSTLTLDKSSTEVESNITATATVRYKNGDLLDGVEVSFARISPSVNMSSTTCVTDLDGRCQITVSSDIPLDDQLWGVLMINGLPNNMTGSPVPIKFTPLPPDARQSTLVLDKDTAEVGADIVATTTVKNRKGEPITGATVSYTVNTDKVTLSQPSCVTGGDGQCSVSVSSDTPGTYPDGVTVLASTNWGQASATGSPATVTFTPLPPDPTQSTLTLDTDTTEVNTNITATTTVKNRKGEPISGATVSYTVNSGDVTLSQPSCTTDSSGQCSVTVNSGTDGTYGVSVQASTNWGQATPTGSPATVTFTPVVTPPNPPNPPNPPSPSRSAYDLMVEAVGVEGVKNNADLIDFGMWINNLPGLDGSGYVDKANDYRTRTTTLLWNGSSSLQDQIIAEGQARSITVRVHGVDYTNTGIEQAVHDLMGLSFDTPQGVWRVTSVAGPSFAKPQITVAGYFPNTEETPTDETVDVIRNTASDIAASGAPGVLVVIKDGKPAPPFSSGTRSTDTAPFWAGGMIKGQYGGGCSSGFAIKYRGGNYITTARHCNQPPYAAYDNSRSSYGSLIYVSDSGMANVLTSKGAPGMFDGAWNEPPNAGGAAYHKDVLGWEDVSEGDLVCSSGANSGVHCNMEITEMKIDFDDGQPDTHMTIRAVQRTPGEIAGAQGDSGGPIFVIDGDHNVYAVGMLQGSQDKSTWPAQCGSLRIPDAECSTQIEFTSVHTILNSLPGSELVVV